VAVIPNSAKPIGCLLLGRVECANVNAIGIITPPVNPWQARNNIIWSRLLASPQRQENRRNKATFTSKYQRTLQTLASQAVSGIVMISPIK
jgi:hypothetical protein